MSFTPRPPLHDQHQRQQEMDVDVDVLMGAAAVLVPTFPARERLGQCGPRYGRYSLPDVRLGGGGY